MRKIIAILFVLATTSSVSQDTVQFNDFEVNASRISSPVYQTGRSVEVINQEELMELPVNSVDEALRYIGGVNINSRNGFGVQADIGMRGSTFSQVLILVDGVRINDPLTAHFNNNISVSMAEIHHIEVVRGPAGVSYGSDAVGGLIHIKTKSFMANSEANKLDVVGDVATGENELHSTDVGVFVQKNKFLVSGSVKTNIADGEEFLNPNFTAGISPDSTYNNFFDLKTYSASLGYIFNENWKLFARGGKDRRDFGAKYYYTQSAYDESVETTDNDWFQTTLTFQKNKHHLYLNAGYKEVDDLFNFNSLFTPNEHKTKQRVINFNHQYKMNETTSLSYGAQSIEKNIISTDRGDHQNGSLGVYAIANKSFDDKLFVTASGRLENDDNFGTEFLPQLSLSYRMDNLVIRSSYGKAIRAADFTERYVSYNIPTLSPGRNAGNPDLKAEQSNSIDLGVDWFPNATTMVSSSIFYRSSDNLIDFSLTNADEITNLNNLTAGADYFYASNVSESSTFGVEISAEKVFQEQFTLRANYTYLETNVPTGELSKYIANHPKHNLSVLLDLRLGKFNLNATTNYITRQAELVESISAEIKDQYMVTSLRLGFRPVDEITVYGKVFNIFDEQYQEILGAQMPGRWLAAGISWRINQIK